MENKLNKRIFYFDVLRAIAILSVILLHAFSSNKKFVVADYCMMPSMNWFATDFVLICLRVGVPLFFILSGALLLGRDWTIKSFLKKRIPRISLPMLFWGFVLSLFMIAMCYIFNLTYINSFSLKSIASYILNAYLANSPGFYQYWFFWAMLGVYFIMPIFNKWICNSDLKELEYFLVIWLVTCLFEFTLGIDFPIKLNYFVSPIGLVVLGYYLRHTERKFLNNPYISLLMVIGSCLIMMIISYLLSSPKEIYVFDQYSILIAIEAIGLVTLCKNFNKLNVNFNFIKNPQSKFRKLISLIAEYSYGMFLIHVAFFATLLRILPYGLLGYKLSLLTFVLVGILVPMILIHLLNKIPYMNQFTGVK